MTEFDREILRAYPDAQWNYGPEGAPTEEVEELERKRRKLWRLLDRQLLEGNAK